MRLKSQVSATFRALGPPPRDPRHRDAWHRHVQTIATCRDRYGVGDDLALGRPAARWR